MRGWLISLVVLVLLALSGCGLFSPRPSGYVKINPADAKKRLEADKKVILVDVRTPEEYAEVRIPNSLLIPVDDIAKEAPAKLPDKSAPIIVYCRTGRRSAIAAQTLSKMGYTNVLDLGGIQDWPYETESGK